MVFFKFSISINIHRHRERVLVKPLGGVYALSLTVSLAGALPLVDLSYL